MTACPTFEAFFRAVHRGRTPLPWQSRLAATVVATGWPSAIGVPTGLGKTACLDIAVWALAKQGERPPAQRTAPTRTWYVVDRRLLVDAAYEHGQYLAHVLGDPRLLRTGSSDDPGVDTIDAAVVAPWPEATEEDIATVAAVRTALNAIAAMGTARSPLHIARLRGGAELGQRSPDPSQPAIIFSTVAMYGSRLLFRGYGSSTLMRPVDAALAGADALVLLDEAHLAGPLMQTCEAARQCDIGNPMSLLPVQRAYPQLVALTATGNESGDRFDLDDNDLANTIVRQRINATKPTTLLATSKRDMTRDLSLEAVRLLGHYPGGAGVVFCNTVDVARTTHDAIDRELTKSGSTARVRLLTGRMRSREGGRVRDDILDPLNGAPAGRDRTIARNAALIVVATQTLEVGADLDFNFLVTESAGARALIQRFGRLNRLGLFADARAVICHPEDAAEQPPYADEPSKVWARLSTQEPLNLSPSNVGRLMGSPHDQAKRSGQLLPAHLWEYAKTSAPEPDEPSPDLFFAGFDESQRRVSVCWRSHIPGPEGDRLLSPSVREGEVVDIPIFALRDFVESEETVDRLSHNGRSLEAVPPRALRPGDSVILPISAGGYDQQGWNPASRDSVLDVAALDGRILWLDTISGVMGAGHPASVDTTLRTLVTIVSPRSDEPVADDDVGRADEVPKLVTGLLVDLTDHKGHPWLSEVEWSSFRDSFASSIAPQRQADGSFAIAGQRAKRERAAVTVRADAFDDLCFDVKSALLRDHQGTVGEQAQAIAERIGLPAVIAASIRRSGAFHDIGKADPRFQRLLVDDHTPSLGGLLAKSGSPNDQGRRAAAGWPRGGRHEALSARLLQAWFDSALSDWDEDLILHLVVSHHGHGRPLVPAVEDVAPPVITVDIEGTTVAVTGDLSVTDWTQPRRFHGMCERYGFWGVALLEAIVRQSDHAASGAQIVVA